MLGRFAILAIVASWLSFASAYKELTADKEYLIKQKRVYELLYFVAEPTIVFNDIYKDGLGWSIEANVNSYTNKPAVEGFLKLYRYGMLPRGEVFSLGYPKLLEETIALFNLFFYAKDFETFYKTAAWARSNINEMQFSYALYVAILYRPDTKYIRIPPLYEMSPHFFFNNEVIQSAHRVKMYGKLGRSPAGSNTYIIPANYSGWYLTPYDNGEHKLNYFIEDIGLNQYYFYLRNNYPFWMKSEDYGMPKSFRGAEYLYSHKLLLSRYYLERLSNDLGRLEDLDWNREVVPGYFPTITQPNGLPFPQRTPWSMIPSYKFKYLKDVQDVESRISGAIDFGYIFDTEGKLINIYTPEGLDIIGNIIEGNADSYNREFYKSIDYLGRKILGYNLEPTSPYQIYPSALEYQITSLRDPVIYRLYKKILTYYYKYQQHYKPYSKEELIYPELKIETVAVDKLLTYFEQFECCINHAVYVESQEEATSLAIKARQYRLNHKPFSIHIALNSDKTTKATVRIFLGPKYDEHNKPFDFTQSYLAYYEIDQWIVDLTAGANKIERNSNDFLFTAPDDESSPAFYKNILKNIESGTPYKYTERLYGFPQRLLLPKGKMTGMPFRLFIYVSPLAGEPVKYSSRIWGETLFDGKPAGFPLDRKLHPYSFEGPNAFFKDIVIYHKDENDLNVTT